MYYPPPRLSHPRAPTRRLLSCATYWTDTYSMRRSNPSFLTSARLPWQPEVGRFRHDLLACGLCSPCQSDRVRRSLPQVVQATRLQLQREGCGTDSPRSQGNDRAGSQVGDDKAVDPEGRVVPIRNFHLLWFLLCEFTLSFIHNTIYEILE